MKRLLQGCSSVAATMQKSNLYATTGGDKVAIRAVSCLFAATVQLLSGATGSQSNYSQSVAASGCHKQEDGKNSFFII